MFISMAYLRGGRRRPPVIHKLNLYCISKYSRGPGDRRMNTYLHLEIFTEKRTPHKNSISHNFQNTGARIYRADARPESDRTFVASSKNAEAPNPHGTILLNPIVCHENMAERERERSKRYVRVRVLCLLHLALKIDRRKKTGKCDSGRASLLLKIVIKPLVCVFFFIS
jgi:hypothetical protein